MNFFLAILITISAVFPIVGYAQYENVWAFGRNAGIDFNTNPPQPIETSIYTNEGCASISDVNGNLLFYTDGYNVWNRNHNLMPNGENLTRLTSNITASTSQGALIVPMPGSLHQYYVFSMGCWECNNLGRLSYSIIDMSLHNGLGDVVKDRKGILLDQSLTEHMTAVAGEHCDIWLITLSRQNNGQFKSYNISVNGINPIPVISFSDPIYDYTDFDQIRGYIDIAPSRTKLAIARNTFVLYDFDPSSGSISKPVMLINQFFGCYGTTFSPDNSKLYVQNVKLGSNAIHTIFGLLQFDLSSGDSLTMVRSKDTIAIVNRVSGSSVGDGAIKRAPDGKIYCARIPSSLVGNAPSYLPVINKPNLKGAACDYVLDGFLLKSGTFSIFGLPNSNSSIFEHHLKNSSYTLVCNKKQLSAGLTSGNHYLWNDGLTTPTRAIDTPGIYWVKYQAMDTKCVEEYVDSFKVLPYESEHYTSSIERNSCWLDTISLTASHLTGTNYQWQDGATGISRAVTESGTYLLTYQEQGNECRNYADSFVVSIPDQDYAMAFITDSFACQHQPVRLRNISDSYYNTFTWEFGNGDTSSERNPAYQYEHPGSYEIMLTGYHNSICPDTLWKTVIIDTQPAIYFSLYPHELCRGQAITIEHQLDDSTVQNLNWQYGDGSYAAMQDITQQHAYDRIGTMHITLKAIYRACPEAAYSDSVIVYPMPVVDLGIDSVLCLQGSPVTLQNRHPHSEGDQYLWSTGAATPYITITQPGNYWLKMSNGFGCTAQENIKITKNCYIDIPNVFTPNGDGVNDYFFPRQLLAPGVNRFHMQVFNRWGQLLFATTNANGKGWDGRFNSREQPEGVYVYKITTEFANETEEKYEGHVTLIK